MRSLLKIGYLYKQQIRYVIINEILYYLEVNMQEEITVIDIFKIIKSHITLIATMSILGLTIAFLITNFLITPEYSSNTQLLVNHSPSENTIQQSEINANIQLINTYEDIIRNPIVLNQVKENLTLSESIDELRNKITVESDQSSQVFSVRVQDENPYLASEIANETANVFQENVDEIMNVDNVSIISDAVPGDSPSSPNIVLNSIIGALIGFFIGLTITFLKVILDTTVKEESFVINEIGWANLGQISKISKSDFERVVEYDDDDDDDDDDEYDLDDMPSRRSRK